MTANMGTHANPEGLPHWTAKHLLAHRLRRGMQNTGRRYGTPFRRQFRRINVPDGLDIPKGLETALGGVKDRVDDISPLKFFVFYEPPHDACDGGYMVVNLLAGMRGGDIKCEEPFGDYIPDVSLYREGLPSPHIAIEVVHTSGISDRKKAFYEEAGVVAFKVATDKTVNVRAATARPFNVVECIANAPCGRDIRSELGKVEQYTFKQEFAEGVAPFIGLKNYPSGTQQYVYGTWHPLGEQRWSAGEPEVLGLFPTPVVWDSPPMISPIEEHSIKRDVFLAFVVKSIGMNEMFLEGKDGRAPTRAEMRAFQMMIDYGIDLLDSVKVPD